MELFQERNSTAAEHSKRLMSVWCNGQINPGDIELVFDIQWQRNICKVAGITPAPSGAILNMLEPYFTIARLKEGKQIGLPTHIENAWSF